jgi:hypothetical protein
MPAIVPAPATDAQPAGGRRRPRCPDRLARDVPGEDAERQRRGERSRQERPADHQPGVGQCEQRHDQVARPRVEGVLQPLVRGYGLRQADAGRPGRLRRGLLPELADPVDGPLQVAARGRVRRGEQAYHHAADRRVHPGLEERRPRRQAKPGVHRALPQADGPGQEDGGERGEPGQQRRHVDVVAVDQRDDHDRGEVVDHGEGEQVGPQPVGVLRADQREHPEREGGVGGHRGAPAARGRLPGVDHEEDHDRHGHAAEAGRQRHRHPAPLAQFPHVELAARFQPDHQEEERH